jgi:hypothetical protein
MRLLNMTTSSLDSLPLHGIHVTPPFKTAEEVKAHSQRKVSEYFGQLTKRQVMEMYEMYRLDHELFDYSPEPYIALAKD